MLLAVHQIRHDSRQSEYTRTNSLSDHHGYPQMQPLKSGGQSGLLLGGPSPLCWDVSRRTSKTSPPDVRNKPNNKSETSLGRRKLKQFQSQGEFGSGRLLGYSRGWLTRRQRRRTWDTKFVRVHACLWLRWWLSASTVTLFRLHKNRSEHTWGWVVLSGGLKKKKPQKSKSAKKETFATLRNPLR